MSDLRSSVFNSVRIVLALSIAVANTSLFAISPAADTRGCYNCVLEEGGAMGWHVECEFGDEGEMSICYEGLDECYGYPCEWSEAAAEAEIEVIPGQFTAPAN